MVELIVLNSNLVVSVVMQNWPMDTVGPFAESLVKRGFRVQLPTAVQQIQVQSGPFAAKGTTTGLGIDYGSRRIFLQITNNITSPNDNVDDVFSALAAIGYPPQESIERIDIQGTITIKTQGDSATTFIPNAVKDTAVKRVSDALGREIEAVGIRLATKEHIGDGASKSPFVILIEPLFNDPTNSKLYVQITYMTNQHDQAILFLKDIYGRLKNVIQGLKSS